ncbi:hypothetical protein FGW37_15760 [Streptomyces rectiverticillatus]|uniref:hypothetical protein n=1 Tax=Streptomyces rectiverticillatus TaxID=173860 RepID=UPI0015C34918|nr:hypothetical protein [Streptomyces rectiverticillatus]QLE72849.1 hypothetical protein FGW37_15760 [Streptomyces rectiverticillatus]
MNENYEYFVKAVPTVDNLYTAERPSSMWRRLGDQWEYLSLVEWEWQSVKATGVLYPPLLESLIPVPAERAAALEADRQGWVRYWARYTDEQDWREGEPPTTVVRRRCSPENVLDESYRGAKGFWGPTEAVLDFYDARKSDPPYLIALSVDEAEGLLQELFGVTGVTEL